MHILVAEDDSETARFIERGLADLGHMVTLVASGPDALQRGSATTFDLIILDRMLPGLEGLEVLRRLRAAAVNAPVLVLTALGGIADRVEGLDAGADDYLVKPFALAELTARINALMRRPPMRGAPENVRLQVGDLTLDMIRREATRAGRTIHLQPREFALLEQLMRNVGRIVTRTMFLEQVWGFHFDPRTNIVESHLSRLRAKLREGFGDDPIETVRGAGYRMRPDA